MVWMVGGGFDLTEGEAKTALQACKHKITTDALPIVST
jgi:hypothetical protein